MNKNRLFKLKYKTLFIIFVIIFIIGGARTYDDVKRNNEILNNKIIETNQILKNSYTQRFNTVKSLILNTGVLLSNSQNVKTLIKNRDREGLYLNSKIYFDTFLKSSKSNRLRMHFHLPNHESFLRVHKKELFGDNLKNIREIITETIVTKKSLSGFEHGKHDNNQLSYRVTFPILEDNTLIAVLEIAFDIKDILREIEKQFLEDNKNLEIHERIKEMTLNFQEYDDFSLKIENCLYRNNKKLLPILKEYERTKKNRIKVKDKTYLLVFDEIKIDDFNKEQIGSIFYLFDITKDLRENEIYFYSSLSKPIIAVIIILLLINFIFGYFLKEFSFMEKRTKNILNAQKSIIILTNGEELLDCNQTLLDFFGMESLKLFKEQFTCVCNTFENAPGYLQKYMDGYLWIDYMDKNKDKFSKVLIKNKDGEKTIFAISLNKYKEEKNKSNEVYYVATLTDITELEKTNLFLIEQSKQASLGEMIGNIAHQWRQPLNSISTVASGVKVFDELGMLKNENISEKMDIILNRTVYLSEIIEIFKNYLKEDKEKKEVILQNRIDTSLKVIEATYQDNHIEIINNINYEEELKITIVLGEFSQVLINILNNAKDALIENKIEHPKVIISMKKDIDTVVIIIEDNAGGIRKDILPKIFDPYFTTKGPEQGTGLGLHMSYKIVTESLGGEIYAKNTNEGAAFIIELPLS